MSIRCSPSRGIVDESFLVLFYKKELLFDLFDKKLLLIINQAKSLMLPLADI